MSTEKPNFPIQQPRQHELVGWKIMVLSVIAIAGMGLMSYAR
jgi:hypothetical protein